MNLYEQISRNKRTTVVLLLTFVALFACLGAGLDYFYGAGYRLPIFTLGAFGFGMASSLAAYWQGDRFVIGSTHARKPSEDDPLERQWENVVGEMSIASGLPLPKVFIIDDADPNAFATGRDPQHASIVATRGLVETLSRDELQAVAAHEMSHIRNYDVRLMLLVAVLVGAIALLSDWTGRGLFRSRGRGERDGRRNDGSGIVILAVWVVVAILAPLISRLIAMCVSRSREYLADASGAELTRNPLALASALEKIEARAEPTRSINQGTAHLCIADPKGMAVNAREGFVADLFATHPPVKKRIEALRAMAYARGEKTEAIA